MLANRRQPLFELSLQLAPPRLMLVNCSCACCRPFYADHHCSMQTRLVQGRLGLPWVTCVVCALSIGACLQPSLSKSLVHPLRQQPSSSWSLKHNFTSDKARIRLIVVDLFQDSYFFQHPLAILSLGPMLSSGQYKQRHQPESDWSRAKYPTAVVCLGLL